MVLGVGLEEVAPPTEAPVVLNPCWHQGRWHMGLLTDSQIPKLESESALHRPWFYDGKGNLNGFLPFLKEKAFPLDPASPGPFSQLPLAPQFSSPGSTTISAPNTCLFLFCLKCLQSGLPHHSPETAVVKGITRLPKSCWILGPFSVPITPDLSWKPRTSNVPPLSLCLVLSQFPDLIIVGVVQGSVLGLLLPSVSTCTLSVSPSDHNSQGVSSTHISLEPRSVCPLSTQTSYIPHRVLPCPCTLPLS